jgi:3-oxoacyl-[acyl-carrier-protein] synthase-1
MTAPLAILACGMVTGVGLSAPASCAAIRCGINSFSETRFMGRSADWIVGSEVSFEKPKRGLTKLANMAASAVRECLDVGKISARPEELVPLILCVPEEDRPGRLPGLGGPLLFEIERELGVKFHPESSVVALGRVGGAVALLRAQKLVHERGHRRVIIAGADSYLVAQTVASYEERDRLLTVANSDGFIPGEAGAALLVGPPPSEQATWLACYAPGFSREPAIIESGAPLRGEGMAEAMRAALAAAGLGMEKVDCRISDLNGEQYRFREMALATSRIRRDHRPSFGIWHPADSIGEVGCAALPVMLGVVHFGARKHYLPGPTFLASLSNDDDKRAAVVVSAQRAA